MKESYDCDCGICSICTGLRRPEESHKSAAIRRGTYAMGKIIQITSAGNDGGIMLYALCDNGRVWEFCHQTGWVELPTPIPKKN